MTNSYFLFEQFWRVGQHLFCFLIINIYISFFLWRLSSRVNNDVYKKRHTNKFRESLISNRSCAPPRWLWRSEKIEDFFLFPPFFLKENFVVAGCYKIVSNLRIFSFYQFSKGKRVTRGGVNFFLLQYFYSGKRRITYFKYCFKIPLINSH